MNARPISTPAQATLSTDSSRFQRRPLGRAIVLTNDNIRDTILRYLHQLHQSARSLVKQQIGIRDLQGAMKAIHGFSQQQVASNLDYLIEQGFVVKILTPRSFHTPSGTSQSSEKITFKIGKAGIDRLEGDSGFRRSSVFSGINITNVHGVVAVGDGNNQSLVQGRYEPLLRSLSALEREIRESALSDERKVNAVADIQTIEFQLAKPQVNHSIVKEAWRGIEAAVTAGHAVELIAKVGELLGPLLAGATALHP